MKKLLLSFLTLIALSACNHYPQPGASASTDPVKISKHPKNIILMIGDGMGMTQVSAALYSNGNKLNMEQFPVIGLQKTYSANDLITDSAAGATAFASGVKTYNGAIGVNEDSMPVKTILEEAEGHGLATGLIATSSITHATPACFIAHVKSRSDMQDIAEDFLKTDIDLFIGGGKKYFDDRTKDSRNLYKELEAKGYNVSDFSKESFGKTSIDYNKNFAYFTDSGEPKKYSEGRNYLVPASTLAPVFLQKRSDKGFFLMIEGSQIDWGGHANDSDYIISEALDFDRAIGAVLEFAKKDGETLVIVTADHETGGYSINAGSEMGKIVGAFTTEHHTGTLIPVFAYGPGSELFNGIYENTAIYDKMRNAFNFKGAPKMEGATSSK